ncbi:TonB-dependent receptor [Sandaracinobacteroides saxicola]|uniref:TonB-dependent receptor n=1 Tax=Sandaracinobacteroides saxicola TaxID=2759707 RepID=A0A7G5IHF1_9SPHN|nr:TonB-dependent receptor [Sandaracinobacteroides saxicola]QMW22793.1 TonB-dependent receptor [Sandaracinobacteroides saxicola]
MDATAFARRTLLLLGAAILPGSALLAQPAGNAPTRAATEEAAPDEIVVTAQLRRQSLQDVPLAISAISGDTLLNQGINNPTDLRFVTPSLNFANSANTRGEGLSIRGVGTSIFGDGVEQSVGVVVDGIPMSRNGMGTMSMIDVDRVEVLRGPQGTLFGKNASAGLIVITTRRPRLNELSLDLGASYATWDDLRLNGVVNVPIGTTGAFRLAVSSTDRDGIITNINRNETLNNRRERIVRGQLLAEPVDDLSILIIGDWSESRTRCCAWTARVAAPGTPFAALNAAQGIVPSATNLRNAAGARFFQDLDTLGVSGEVNYDAGFATLTGIVAYREWNAFDNNDPDILPLNVLDVNAGDSRVQQFSAELRLTSRGESAFQWLVGAFYFDVANRGGNEQTGTLGVPLPPGGTLGNRRDSETYNYNKALYGQLSYAFTDWFKLSASGRYTDEILRFDWRQRPSGTLGAIPGRPTLDVRGARITTDNFSWRVIAQVDPAPDVMAFASVARGYKGPAYDQQLVSATPVFVQPEIPTSYEIGLRSTLFDRKLTLNLTAFKTDFENFQAQAFDQNVFPSRFTTVNAGKLSTRGIEADIMLRPVAGLSLSGAATYLDSEYKDFKNIACFVGATILPFGTPRTDPRQCIRVSPTGGGVTTGDGLPLTDAPKFTYTLQANYETPVSDALKVGANVNWFWRDDVVYSSNGDPGLRQDSYGLLGASLALAAADDRWRVTLFARNLLDKHFVSRIIPQPVLNAAGTNGLGSYSQFPSADARRIVGVSLDLKLR